MVSNKDKLLSMLLKLNEVEFNESALKEIDLNQFFITHCNDVWNQLNISAAESRRFILENFKEDVLTSPEIFPEWNYVSLNFYLFTSINLEMSKTKDFLSFQQTKQLKKCIQNVLVIGIFQNIMPKLPFSVKIPKDNSIAFRYSLLKLTTMAFISCIEENCLRNIFIPDILQALLVALYQLAYAPFKKNQNSEISDDFYVEVLNERIKFASYLDDLPKFIHPMLINQQSMLLLHYNLPVWSKKALFKQFEKSLKNKQGVVNILIPMLGGETDVDKTWKPIDIITKIIINSRNLPDFQERIFPQIFELLDESIETHEQNNWMFERVYASCAKSFVEIDHNYLNTFISAAYKPLTLWRLDNPDLFETDEIFLKLKTFQSIFLLDLLINKSGDGLKPLPAPNLSCIIFILFRLYVLLNSVESVVKSTLSSILKNYLESLKTEELFATFDYFIFNIEQSDVFEFRNDVEIKITSEKIIAKKADYRIRFSVSENINTLRCSFEENVKLSLSYFQYFLRCLCEPEIYLKLDNNALLDSEFDWTSESLDRMIAVYSTLSNLANNKEVQNEIIENPSLFITYVEHVFSETLARSIHKSNKVESDEFQLFFTVSSILQGLLVDSSADITRFHSLVGPLKQIKNESLNAEVQNISNSILNILNVDRIDLKEQTKKTVVNLALEDAYDTSLPTKGHGLIVLTKLVKERDEHAMERRLYILNTFKANLSNKDSYIYLAAINGLAVMALLFTESALSKLCEEYVDFAKDDFENGNETRMKVGEVIVTTTKTLGDLASKYKASLLNAFLVVVKDDDNLMRASALSNLGEICLLLGYKLGSIVHEILTCLDSVISTDKAIEPRRAAVLVLAKLIAGLQKDMLSYLREDMLPIYRTLKRIYLDENDDVMKLQAQIALEALNENMQEILFSKPIMNLDKDIVILK